MSEIYYLRIR